MNSSAPTPRSGTPWLLQLGLLLLTLSLLGAQASHPAVWPDPLVLCDGTQVTTAEQFQAQRRPELLRLFAENVYGRTPTGVLPVRLTDADTDLDALGGVAVRKQLTLAVGEHGERTWHLLLYLPAHAKGPVPVIVGLNFDGNHTVNADPGITLHPVWTLVPPPPGSRLAAELAPHALTLPSAFTRGSAAGRWQLESILQHGYGLATIQGSEIEPDFVGGFAFGMRPLFFQSNQRLPGPHDWGALGVWAWSMSRVIDVLSTDPTVDSRRFVAFGFSRFGKAALWAAAQDRRFALVLSNEAGQAGDSLIHRQRGESLDHLILAFPYWFTPAFHRYLEHPQDVPVDGHLLLSLIAPRPLYVGSALDDPFSDPEGEFLAARAASPVYALFGVDGLALPHQPPLDTPALNGTIAYHVRHGGHDVTAFDWAQYLRFMDQLWGPHP